MRDGFDPAKTKDALYFDDMSQRNFIPLDGALYRLIATGEVRL